MTFAFWCVTIILFIINELNSTLNLPFSIMAVGYLIALAINDKKD